MKPNRIFSAFLALLFVLVPALMAATPARAISAPAIETDKIKAAYVSCLETGDELYTFHPEDELFTTSSTKLMTAIIAIEELSSKLDEKVTVTSQMRREVSGNRRGLKAC